MGWPEIGGPYCSNFRKGTQFMRDRFPRILEEGRLLQGPNASAPGDRFGAFVIRNLKGQQFRLIAIENGKGWDHVSVTMAQKRTPTWDEMVWLKRLFWRDDECVVQFHPPASDYVNHNAYCLHLWKRCDGDFPMPPKECV